MRVDLFDFDLPEENIALRPVNPRDTARMLVVGAPNADTLQDRTVLDLAACLDPGDALVFNDTRVIPVQLEGIRDRSGATARVGVTLHLRLDGESWKAFARGARKLAPDDRIIFSRGTSELGATVIDKGEGGEVDLRFDLADEHLDAALKQVGTMPLPPYIGGKREQDAQDLEDYQTVYARKEGAVAAPTAGLHFTDRLFEALDARNVERHYLTLHVGAGTFLPVKVDDTSDHKMHSEWGEIDQRTADRLNAVRARGNRIVAVGTTSLRLLESAAQEDGSLQPFSGTTDIFITPGYRFKCVDALMTNFHLPRSTLFMLVSALAGTDRMRDTYRYAISNGYRFYSYGDSSLLFRS